MQMGIYHTYYPLSAERSTASPERMCVPVSDAGSPYIYIYCSKSGLFLFIPAALCRLTGISPESAAKCFSHPYRDFTIVSFL